LVVAGARRRIHQSPDTVLVDASRPWLLAAADPVVVVVLGATAGTACSGPRSQSPAAAAG